MKKHIDSPWKTTLEIRIPFHDLDPMNVSWYGNVYKYFDRARGKLLDSVGYGREAMRESGYMWPIIESRCRHTNFIRGTNIIQVTAGIEDFDQRLKTRYLVHDDSGDTRLAIGYTVQIALDQETGEMTLETPELLKRRLREVRE